MHTSVKESQIKYTFTHEENFQDIFYAKIWVICFCLI